MKTTETFHRAIRVSLFIIGFAGPVLFSACNNDKAHSATDGGNMKMLQTDTLNLPDTTMNVQP